METMQDLLEKVLEFASRPLTREEAKGLFGWDVLEFQTSSTQVDESHISIVFENGYIIFIKYFLNLDPSQTDDICEFTLGLKTDLCSRIKYGIHYGNYIHGQGYIRIRIADVNNIMLQMILEEFHVPAIKKVYRSIITQFRGFYSSDFFGVETDSKGGYIYYAPVRSRSENKGARLGDVIGKLTELDILLKDPGIRQDLAKVDFQLSLLPSMMDSGL